MTLRFFNKHFISERFFKKIPETLFFKDLNSGKLLAFWNDTAGATAWYSQL